MQKDPGPQQKKKTPAERKREKTTPTWVAKGEERTKLKTFEFDK